MLHLTQIKTGSEQQLEWFLEGKHIPIEVSTAVIRELSEAHEIFSYKDLLTKVKSKLTSHSITFDRNVLYVKYETDIKTDKTELAILVRVINLRYNGKYSIVLNCEEIVYVPNDYKFTTAMSEIIEDLTFLSNKVGRKVKRASSKETLPVVEMPTALLEQTEVIQDEPLGIEHNVTEEEFEKELARSLNDMSTSDTSEDNQDSRH